MGYGIENDLNHVRQLLRYQVCNPAYLVPVPSQDKLGRLCQEGIKMVVVMELMAQMVWMG